MIMYNDYPIEDCIKKVNELRQVSNVDVHQKWTCKHCGSRQTMAEVNSFHRAGRCEECDQVTIIEKCNYLLIMPGRKK
jgi:hypothetical protein